MNVFLLMGIVIVLGVFSGRLFHKIRLPQVTAYIIIGLILRPLFGGTRGGPDIESFRYIISLALGTIGFLIGSELHFKRFKRYSRTVYTTLFFEAFLSFSLVAAAVTLLTGELFMGLILGALSSATAPAATYGVLDEYKARGPLTTSTLSIVALDDALALVIYGFVSVFSMSLLTGDGISLMQGVGIPLLQILISVAIGVSAGFVLDRTAASIKDRDMLLPFVFGTIVFVVGAAMFLDASPILACMALGTVAANLKPIENREVFDVVKKFSSPVFVLFFVLVGARLDGHILFRGGVMVIAIVYVLARTTGKVFGAYIGGKLSGASNSVRKYLGLCLMDQAGVAVGLSVATLQMFSSVSSSAEIAGIMIVNIIAATTLMLQLVAPSLIRFAVLRADEAMRNVTEEDIIERYLVKDVMDEDFLVVKENYNLHHIIDIMKTSDSYDFPVVDDSGVFKGIVTLGEIRDAFYEEQMDLLVVAGDLVRNVEELLYPDQALSQAMDIFRSKNIDYLPVVSPDGKQLLVGQLSHRRMRDRITKELLMRQQELEKKEEIA